MLLVGHLDCQQEEHIHGPVMETAQAGHFAIRIQRQIVRSSYKKNRYRDSPLQWIDGAGSEENEEGKKIGEVSSTVSCDWL